MKIPLAYGHSGAKICGGETETTLAEDRFHTTALSDSFHNLEWNSKEAFLEPVLKLEVRILLCTGPVMSYL